MAQPEISYEFDPHKFSKRIHEAIGLYMMCAAQTEDLIDEAISACVGVDSEMGHAITTHLGMLARLSILKSTAEIRISDPNVLAECDALILATEKAFETRNSIAHQRWLLNPETGETGTVKERARTTYTVDLVPLSVAEIKREAEVIYDVGLRIFEFLKRHRLQPPLPSKDRVRGQNTEAERRKRRDAFLKQRRR